MLDKSCVEFITALASKEPIPGGGGASAYVGSIGMALGVMVGNLTVGKKRYADVEADIITLMEKAQRIIEKLQILAKEDAAAFYPLSQAYGLPKNTEEEARIKEETLQKALVQATLVPLNIAKCCAEGIDLQEEFAQKGTRIAISDVGVGVSFLKAALEGAQLNVLINTQIMKDQEFKQWVEKDLANLISTYLAKADRIFVEVQQRITGGE